MKRQTEIMVDNIMGQGIDIHLLGLREAARETAPTAAHPLPELFTDDTYKIANYFLLSTSQVTITNNVTYISVQYFTGFCILCCIIEFFI